MEKMEVTVGGTKIESKSAINYLAVIVGDRLNVEEQVKFIGDKTSVTQGALARMTPNIGRPSPFKRRIISNVICLPNMVGGILHGDDENESVLCVSPKCE